MSQQFETTQRTTLNYPIPVAAKNYPLPARGNYIPEVTRLLDNAREALVTDDNVVETCIRQALMLLQRQCEEPDQPATPSVARGGLAPWQIKRVEAHIQDNLDSTIRVADLAQLIKLSVSYFSVAFRRSFGVTVSVYISRRRIERAQTMMKTTSQHLSWIAAECGFCDQAHLSRQFRSLVGTTPQRWRRENQICGGTLTVRPFKQVLLQLSAAAETGYEAYHGETATSGAAGRINPSRAGGSPPR